MLRVLNNWSASATALFRAVIAFSSYVLAGIVPSPDLQAAPFDSAEISRIENRVEVGDREEGGRAAAKLQQVVRENNFVVTQDQSRAELTFPDGSLARVGQNSVFTFDGTRTLELKRGAMLFYVNPKGGRGTIKTPSLTAAITGTVGLVAENMIAVLSGELTLPDGTVVPEGYAVEWTGDGLRVFRFDPAGLRTGYLVQWGPLPQSPFTLPTDWLHKNIPLEILRQIERGEITQLDPRVPVPDPKPEKEEEEEDNDRSPTGGGEETEEPGEIGQF